MTLPPAPQLPQPMGLLSAPPPPGTRTCSSCSSAMQPQGARPFRTAGVNGTPDGVMVLEMFWCPGCGKVDFASVR